MFNIYPVQAKLNISLKRRQNIPSLFLRERGGQGQTDRDIDRQTDRQSCFHKEFQSTLWQMKIYLAQIKIV